MAIAVIFNPTAKGDKARQSKRFLDQIGHEATLMFTSAPNSAATLAAEAIRAGFDTVVAAGGDGTLNEVLNGICAVPDGLAKTRLGILPVGTMNVFARELGLPLDVRAAWETIRRGHEALVDIVTVQLGDARFSRTRYFVQMAGAGLDARAIELVDFGAKKMVGPVAYVLAGLNALGNRQPRIRVKAGNASAEGELVLIGNGRLYGGPFRVFPEANQQDGLLEICIFPKMNYGTLATCGSALLLLKRLPEKAVHRFKAERVTLESSERVPFEVDGEFAGELPATLTVEHQKLRVITR